MARHRGLPSAGITRLPRYYAPVRHSSAARPVPRGRPVGRSSPTTAGASRVASFTLKVSRPAQRSPTLRPAGSWDRLAVLCSEGFGDVVTSSAAPIATDWSESCRAGITPAEERRLGTAHSDTILFAPSLSRKIDHELQSLKRLLGRVGSSTRAVRSRHNAEETEEPAERLLRQSQFYYHILWFFAACAPALAGSGITSV